MKHQLNKRLSLALTVIVMIVTALGVVFQPFNAIPVKAAPYTATTEDGKPWDLLNGSDAQIEGAIDYANQVFLIMKGGAIVRTRVVVDNAVPTDAGKLWTLVYGDDSQIAGMVVFEKEVFIITKSGSITGTCVKMEGFQNDKDKKWHLLWGTDSRLLQGGIIGMADQNVYLSTDTDAALYNDCADCTVPAQLHATTDDTPGTSVTATPTTPGQPTPTAGPNPTKTPPVKKIHLTKNCGVGNGVDGDTKGCPNGSKDGPKFYPGFPGAKGGNGNPHAAVTPAASTGSTDTGTTTTGGSTTTTGGSSTTNNGQHNGQTTNGGGSTTNNGQTKPKTNNGNHGH